MQGKVSRTCFRKLPLFTHAAGNGTLTYESLDTQEARPYQLLSEYTLAGSHRVSRQHGGLRFISEGDVSLRRWGWRVRVA